MTNSHPEQAYADVLKVLGLYYDGLYRLDIEQLAKVFSPSARYASASSGELIELSIEDYLPRLSARVAPAEAGTPFGFSVDLLTFAGPVTALAKLRCSLFDHDYIDFLTLVRLNGEWRIQSKVFHGQATHSNS